MQAAADEIVGCIKKSIEDLDTKDVENPIDLMLASRDEKIFTVGMGRSGFVARGFALRLMNLGFNMRFLGETIMPVAKNRESARGDLQIAISGTGATKIVLTGGSAAGDIDAKVATVTSFPKSPLGKLADLVVSVRGKTKADMPRED